MVLVTGFLQATTDPGQDPPRNLPASWDPGSSWGPRLSQTQAPSPLHASHFLWEQATVRPWTPHYCFISAPIGFLSPGVGGFRSSRFLATLHWSKFLAHIIGLQPAVLPLGGSLSSRLPPDPGNAGSRQELTNSGSQAGESMVYHGLDRLTHPSTRQATITPGLQPTQEQWPSLADKPPGSYHHSHCASANPGLYISFLFLAGSALPVWMGWNQRGPWHSALQPGEAGHWTYSSFIYVVCMHIGILLCL